MELQEKLTQFRKDRGLSQMEVAEELGVSRQAVSRWETGAAVPSSSNLICLSRLYGVPLDELVEEKQAEGPPEASPPPDAEELPEIPPSPAGEHPPETTPPPPAENPKGKLKRRVISIILIVLGIMAVYLLIWKIGDLTRSPTVAKYFMELLWQIIWRGLAVYALYRVIVFIKRR